MNFKEFLLLEKKIGHIKSKIEIEVDFNYDVIKTTHSTEREDFSKRGLNIQTYGIISNEEIVDFLHFFKKDISREIALGNIKPEESFVIKSLDWQLAMAVIAKNIRDNHWKLIVKTVFRETHFAQLRVGKNQLVLKK